MVALLALSVAACTGKGVTAPTAISPGPGSVVPVAGAVANDAAIAAYHCGNTRDHYHQCDDAS